MQGNFTDAQKKLYDALGYVGKIEKTIRPSALEGRPEILRAPAVNRRAGTSATVAQLAKAAHDTLIAEIADIVSPRDRLVAEAALCADTVFEGKTVEQRKDFLESDESPLRVSRNEYRRARERVLGNIVHRLTRVDEPASTDIVSSSIEAEPKREIYDARKEYLNNLAEKAAHLHYAGLACLFMATIQSTLVKAGLVSKFEPSHYGSDFMRDAYFECAFWESYGNPPLRGVLALTDSGLERGPGYTPALDQSSAETLSALMIRLLEIGPLGSSEHTLIRHGIEGRLGRGDLVQYRMVVGDSWSYWHTQALRGMINKTSSQFEDIARTAGEIGRLIGDHVYYRRPIFALARATAHKRIALCYSFDEWQPVVNGQSLRAMADRYFDQHSVG